MVQKLNRTRDLFLALSLSLAHTNWFSSFCLVHALITWAAQIKGKGINKFNIKCGKDIWRNGAFTNYLFFARSAEPAAE